MKRIVLFAALFLASVAFFIHGIDRESQPYFDEHHYVSAARVILAGHADPNVEHPPLGKQLIALGMLSAGDGPLGWRLMSAVFSAFTLLAFFAGTKTLFGHTRIALWATGITFFNQLVYVQARVAMLDTFMTAFLAASLFAYGVAVSTSTSASTSLAASAAASPSTVMPEVNTSRRKLGFLALAGLLIGLATACKLFAALPCAALTLYLVIRGLGRGERLTVALKPPVVFGSAALIAYVLPYIWAPGELFSSILERHRLMFDAQSRVPEYHPYMSSWYSWPLMIRPIWYSFEKVDVADLHRSIVLLGNPLVMWGGFVALIACARDYLRTRSPLAFRIVATYLVLYASWILIPRRLLFFYFYYPASFVLSLALAYFFWHQSVTRRHRSWLPWTFLAMVAGVFLYFLPILSSQPISQSILGRWLWFGSWI